MIKRLFKLIGDILKFCFDFLIEVCKFVIKYIKKTFRIIGSVFK